MNQEQLPNEPTVASQPGNVKPGNSKKTLIIVLVTVGILVIVLPIIAIWLTVSVGLGGAREKAKDSRIKADVAEMRTEAENYYAEHSTYKGFDSQPNAQTLINDAKAQGSEMKQNIGDKTYVAYALLPSAKKIYCADATGFAGEVTSISPEKTSCQ